MRCKRVDGSSSTVTWRLFYVNCARINQLCNQNSKAYVAAAVVCRQRLF